MKLKLSEEQRNEVVNLQRWFDKELRKLKKRQLEILREYDQKKSILLKRQLDLRSKSQ